MIKRLDAYQRNAKGTYKGISKSYYPKWSGWELLDNGADYNTLEHAVKDFYMAYYWYNLKLDLVDNEELAFCLFNFAVENGKSKCLQKIHLVSEDIEGLNSLSKGITYKLLLELLEFYSYTKSTNIGYILECYKYL